MAVQDSKSVERIATKQTVTQLFRALTVMNSRMGEERAEYGKRVEGAVKNHLDKKAFGIVASLAKLEAGKAARHWRNAMIYAEHLGIGDQADLEDAIASSEKGEDVVQQTINGKTFDQGRGAKAKQAASTLHPEKALKAFRATLGDCTTGDGVQIALQKFVSAHQDLANEAELVAGERVTDLAMPTVAKARKGRKPKSPAAQSAKDFGIGA